MDMHRLVSFTLHSLGSNTSLHSMPVPTPPFAAHHARPQTTTTDLKWAELPIIDISKARTGQGLAELVPAVRDAMHTNGFMYVINHGLNPQQNDRIFDIADIPFTDVPDAEKKDFEATPRESGYWKGYKLRRFFHIDNGVHDQIEMYSAHHVVEMQEHPEAIQPFLPEMSAFVKTNIDHVVDPILRILALGLELPEDALTNLHQFDGASGRSWLRFQKYYPYTKEDGEKAGDVWLKGHTDSTCLSVLWSQPISALQIKASNGEWRWVRHIENALIVNIGDGIEMLSGGFYKAAIHRVVQPPPDQRGLERLTVFFFVVADKDVKLAPLIQSPVLQRVGIARKCADEDAPTMAEWMHARLRTYGNAMPLAKNADGTEAEEMMRGIQAMYYN
ncbi:Clavaminate synthase-like protein [Daedaleopsis nitida]|nr:Clavaminate synthase-like protein [Daedaleopsis nitida]